MNPQPTYPAHRQEAHFLVISSGIRGRTVTRHTSLGAAQHLYRDLQDSICLLRQLGYPQAVELQIRDLAGCPSGEGAAVAQIHYPAMSVLSA